MRRTQCRRRDDASKSGGERRPERVRPVRLRQAVCAAVVAVVAVVRGTQLVCVRGVRFRAQNRGQGCSQARATNRERTARRTRAGPGLRRRPAAESTLRATAVSVAISGQGWARTSPLVRDTVPCSHPPAAVETSRSIHARLRRSSMCNLSGYILCDTW